LGRDVVVGVDLNGVFAEFVEGSRQLVEWRGGVVGGEPEGFAVLGVTGAVEVLFLALVDYGDAVKEESECEDIFGELSSKISMYRSKETATWDERIRAYSDVVFHACKASDVMIFGKYR
jgi:hypothetical protein